jgi:Flp pilus assembly protein TadG
VRMTLARPARRLRGHAGDEHGAVLVIVAGCMVLFLSLGAYTIDLGSGRQAEAKAQSAADAAALAVSDAASSGTTSTAALTTVAQTMLGANDDAGQTVQAVTKVSPGVYQVIVSGNSSGTLASAIGKTSPRVSAAAIAAASTTVTTSTTTSSSCSSAGSGCLAVFAGQTGCSGDAVTLGGGSITGGVWSDGSLYIGGGGSTFAALTYANGCSVTPAGGIQASQNYQGNTFKDGLPQAEAPLTTWPIDYATDFPSCSGSGCTGPCADANNYGVTSADSNCATSRHTPSFCTQASNNASWTIDAYYPYSLVSDEIYCAVGSGTPNTPSTWNGALLVNGSGTVDDSTYVAGSITVGGGSSLTACGYNLPTYNASNCAGTVPAPSTPDYPLFYAISGTINASSGGNGMTGDWFAPAGSISVGGGTSFVGFLEAQTVNLSSGGIQGDGPADSGTQVGSTTTSTVTATIGSKLTG